MLRGPFLAVLLALSALLLGCGRSAESVQEIPVWTLHVEGAEGDEWVTLPAHIDGRLPAERSRYTLRARVALGAELRGHDLVLALPSLPALATLRVGGMNVDALDPATSDLWRSRGPHAWRVPRAAIDGDTVNLELVVTHTWPMSGWIEGVPRLSATPAGDASFRRVAFVLDAGNALALGTMWSAGFTYLVLFLFAPARRHYGWFALQALCAAHYPLFLAAWTQLAGRYDTGLLGVSQPWAALAGLHFTYAAFELGRPPRWPLAAATCAACLGLAVTDPFVQLSTLAPLTCVVCLAIVLHHLTLLARVARRPAHRVTALILGLSWIFVLAALTIDGGAFVGVGGYLGGYRVGSWALAFVAMAQSAALGREHVESLRTADALNVTLAQRLGEIEALNDELRRKIGERSREVRAALTSRTSFTSIWPTVGGVIVGRYRVQRLLGAGGMGRVYEVTSERNGRRLALKVLGVAATDDAMVRVAREAELAARVVHPNVVSIVDFDVGDDGLPFLVLEYVDGASLEEHRHRFGDVPWALGVLAQIAAGLEAIHARGIVHRDLKPANVLLADATGTARITDFGISSSTPSAGRADRTGGATATGPTETGLLLGTPAYMAPELARGGRDATPLADAFGFAVLAFEMLTGGRPFHEPPVAAALRGERVVPMVHLADLAPTVPAAVAELVDRALRCDPPLRPTASSFARALAPAPARAA